MTHYCPSLEYLKPEQALCIETLGVKSSKTFYFYNRNLRDFRKHADEIEGNSHLISLFWENIFSGE